MWVFVVREILMSVCLIFVIFWVFIVVFRWLMIIVVNVISGIEVSCI